MVVLLAGGAGYIGSHTSLLLFRSTSRLWLARRICQPDTSSVCTGISIPGLCFPHASPQFCLYVVQESKPVVHRIRLSTSP